MDPDPKPCPEIDIKLALKLILFPSEAASVSDTIQLI